MEICFEITSPLVLDCDKSFTMRFETQSGKTLQFKKGMYYLYGENGAGKTTLVNMLALLAGRIGNKGSHYEGTITFNGEAYNGDDFNYIKAGDIREKSFSIFPQKAFFLPISTRDNYIILNGSEKKKEKSFSSQEYPDLLSGGQQQKILMDIVLDEKKPVWFLDEPLTNMDDERRQYFWETLDRAFKKNLNLAFFIDHWMGEEIKNDKDFRLYSTLNVSARNPQKGKSGVKGSKEIEIYENTTPEKFFIKQIQKIESIKSN